MRKPRSLSIPLLLVGLVAVVFRLAAPAPATAQGVTLSLERFQKLWDQAHPKPPDPPPPALPIALESAQLSVHTWGETARITTEITVVLAPSTTPEWRTIELPQIGALLAIEAPGLEIDLPNLANASTTRGVPNPTPVLRVRGTGRHTVKIESALPLVRNTRAVEAEQQLVVTWPSAAWVTGVLTTGRTTASNGANEGIERVEVESGGAIEPNGPGHWNLIGEPGAPLVLRLFGRAAVVDPTQSEPLSWDVDSASVLAVSRARRRLTSYLQVHLRSGRAEDLEQLRVPVPAGYEVVSVTGDRLFNWEVSAGQLEIFLRRQPARELGLVVQLAADPTGPEATLDGPVLVPTGARTVRAARKVAVRGNDGLLEPLDPKTLERLPLDQLGGFASGFREAAGEPLRADGATPTRWRVTWATGGEVLTGQIDRLLVEVLIGEAGTVHYQLWAEARNGEAALEFRLPAGARLLSAQRDGAPVTLGESADGSWAVPMVVRESTQIVSLEALIDLPFPTQGGALKVPLPRLGVPASRVEVRVAAPPGFRYTLAEPSRATRLAPPPSASGIGFLAPIRGFTVLEAGWAGWSQEPPPLAIDVKPLETSGRAR